MALSPLSTEARATKVVSTPQPSRTYALSDIVSERYTIGVSPVTADNEYTDLDGTIIDGESAIRQYARKALATVRYRYTIYDALYGSELETLIGSDVTLPLLQAEIPRIIREALIYDDRIDDVTDFEITRDADKLYVSFSLVTKSGIITEEVTLNNV